MSDLRLVIADDSMLIRTGVRAMVDATPGLVVVAECVDGEALREAVDRERPDVVITDIRMPPTMTDEGIAAAIAFRRAHPDMGVVVLSQYVEAEYVMMLFAEGSAGLGYLLKERIGDLDEFERAVRSVAAGDSAVDPVVVEALVSAGARRQSDLDRLTPREREVLALIAEGCNNQSIARNLVIGDKAVAKHINGIFSKLGLGADDDVHRRVKAVLLWLAA